MNVWKRLGIEPTSDKKLIKKAYHALLKNTHPEECPESFMELRMAYEKALELADNWLYEDIVEDENEEVIEDYSSENEENTDYEDDYREGETEIYDHQVYDWWSRVQLVWTAYKRRCEPEEWKQLLYKDIPYQVVYYEKCRDFMWSFIMAQEYLLIPEAVLRVIDGFFGFSLSETAATIKGIRWVNKLFKLNERIDFDSIVLLNEAADVDGFFMKYMQMYDLYMETVTGNCSSCTDMEDEESFDTKEAIEALYKSIEECGVYYPPAVCIYILSNIENYSREEFYEYIEALRKRYGNDKNLKLLEAEYLVHKGDILQAQAYLEALYHEVLPKDYMFILRMALCCEGAGLYYNAYMFVKQLAWLNPQSFIKDMADRLYKEYTDYYYAIEEPEDTDTLMLCRMCLRSNKEKQARELLLTVKEDKHNVWEYNILWLLSVTEGVDINSAIEAYEKLMRYPKEELSELSRIEWQEVQLRYLFEQKKYLECMEGCNRLLDIYPLSYPILLLRAYADYCMFVENMSTYKKRYSDMQSLTRIFPDRVEALLLLAKLQVSASNEELICEVLEPVKDICTIQYQFGYLNKLRKQSLNTCIEETMKLLGQLNEAEYYIPAVSKYNLIDLKAVYDWAVGLISYVSPLDRSNKYKELLKSLIHSKYNSAEEYVSRGRLYMKLGQYECALEYYLEELNTVSGKQKNTVLMDILYIYGRMGEYEKMENQLAQIDTSLLTDISRARMYEILADAYRYGKMRDEEKADYYYAKMLKEQPSSYNYYTYSDFYLRWGAMGNATDKYEMALKLAREGLVVCGKTGDIRFYEELSMYELISDICVMCNRYDEAIKAINDMNKYTRRENIRKSYYYKLAKVYEYKNDIARAYDAFAMAQEQEPQDLICLAIWRCLLKLERYEEAYNSYLEYINNEEQPDPTVLMCAAHAWYLAFGKHDMELIVRIKELIEKQLAQGCESTEDEFGEFYSILVDVYSIMGDRVGAEFYNEKLHGYEWEDSANEITNYVLPLIWDCWYKQDYEGAAQIIKDNPECLDIGHIEIDALDYLLESLVKQ